MFWLTAAAASATVSERVDTFRNERPSFHGRYPAVRLLAVCLADRQTQGSHFTSRESALRMKGRIWEWSIPQTVSGSTTLRFDDEAVLEENELLVDLIIAATLSADTLTPRRVDEVLRGQRVDGDERARSQRRPGSRARRNRAPARPHRRRARHPGRRPRHSKWVSRTRRRQHPGRRKATRRDG